MIKKNKYPFVSIVTPNYNGEKYLEETIKSIINQTSHDYEFILVDGKSTDNSLNIIKKYLKKINIFISEKDKSMYHAIDKGISKAKGEVIIWINSDDLLHKKAVQNVSKIFKKNPEIDWISGINGYIKKNIQFSGIPYIYPKFILSKGYANHAHWGFVQQESISFRKNFTKSLVDLIISIRILVTLDYGKNFQLLQLCILCILILVFLDHGKVKTQK